MPVLSREEFDAIEFDAAASGDHESAARRMNRLAWAGTETETMPRSEAFLRAGEQWLLADDPAAAATGFRLALADGGPVFVDPRVPLARALFMLDQPAEAQALLDQLKAEGRRDPRACDLVAELLVEQLVVAVLGKPEVVADPVPQAQQQSQLRLGAALAARGVPVSRARRAVGPALQAQHNAGGRPVQRPGQVGALDEQLGDEVAGPRVPLARALFMLDQPAEAQALLDQRKAEGRRDPRACDLVAELLVERSDLTGALDWATAGVELCLQRQSNGEPGPADRDSSGDEGGAEAELRLLLSLRYRIRNDLGLPEDRYDELLDEA